MKYIAPNAFVSQLLSMALEVARENGDEKVGLKYLFVAILLGDCYGDCEVTSILQGENQQRILSESGLYGLNEEFIEGCRQAVSGQEFELTDELTSVLENAAFLNKGFENDDESLCDEILVLSIMFAADGDIDQMLSVAGISRQDVVRDSNDSSWNTNSSGKEIIDSGNAIWIALVRAGQQEAIPSVIRVGIENILFRQTLARVLTYGCQQGSVAEDDTQLTVNEFQAFLLGAIFAVSLNAESLAVNEDIEPTVTAHVTGDDAVQFLQQNNFAPALLPMLSVLISTLDLKTQQC